MKFGSQISFHLTWYLWNLTSSRSWICRLLSSTLYWRVDIKFGKNLLSPYSDLIFYLEDGSNCFLRNISKIFTMLHDDIADKTLICRAFPHLLVSYREIIWGSIVGTPYSFAFIGLHAELCAILQYEVASIWLATVSCLMAWHEAPPDSIWPVNSVNVRNRYSAVSVAGATGHAVYGISRATFNHSLTCDYLHAYIYIYIGTMQDSRQEVPM